MDKEILDKIHLEVTELGRNLRNEIRENEIKELANAIANLIEKSSLTSEEKNTAQELIKNLK